MDFGAVTLAVVLVIGFLMLASPTIRKELFAYFDLQSARRKKAANPDEKQ